MKNQLKTERDNIYQLADNLVINLQTLECLEKELHPNVVLISQQIEQIKSLLAQLPTTLTYTLLEEEYVHFCDLIVCGSEMANYLLISPLSTRAAKRHALFWQKTVKEFKPFLNGIIDYLTNKKSIFQEEK